MGAITLMKGTAPPEGLAGFADAGAQVDYHEAGQTALKLASLGGLGYVTLKGDLPGWARVLTGLAALQQGARLLRAWRGAPADDQEQPVPQGGVPTMAGAPRTYRARDFRVRV